MANAFSFIWLMCLAIFLALFIGVPKGPDRGHKRLGLGLCVICAGLVSMAITAVLAALR